MTWETIGVNVSRESSYVDLPLINKFMKSGEMGVFDVEKIVWLKEKNLFILETAKFKAFVSEKYNQSEHRALLKDGLTGYIYAIEIEKGAWELKRQKTAGNWDITDKASSIIFESPLDCVTEVKKNDDFFAPKIDNMPF